MAAIGLTYCLLLRLQTIFLFTVAATFPAVSAVASATCITAAVPAIADEAILVAVSTVQ